ncbi:uncharacterized protein LOC129618240 [Condylostylus longicornis]|uniref:uncharacterized protein LOC129618240 n=1 Tax=Condylostylus longicornis TaxID=2530218 RepID=UPI00244E3B7C|nr:uncharacterized protein LOC129618240 [Condylostylus longicornis]
MKNSKIVGGRLKLKGVAISKHSKKKSKSSAESGLDPPPTNVESQQAPEPGSGRLVTTGTTVQGFETKFKEEIEVGDAIILFHPSLLIEEERIVVGVLSQRSLTLHEKFSNDIASTTAYKIRKDSTLLRQKAGEALATNEGASSGSQTTLQDEISRQLQKKLDNTRQTFRYREKTGMWGYRVVTGEAEKNLSAEELLDMRVKKMGRDKFCW